MRETLLESVTHISSLSLDNLIIYHIFYVFNQEQLGLIFYFKMQ